MTPIRLQLGQGGSGNVIIRAECTQYRHLLQVPGTQTSEEGLSPFTTINDRRENLVFEPAPTPNETLVDEAMPGDRKFADVCRLFDLWRSLYFRFVVNHEIQDILFKF